MDAQQNKKIGTVIALIFLGILVSLIALLKSSSHLPTELERLSHPPFGWVRLAAVYLLLTFLPTIFASRILLLWLPFKTHYRWKLGAIFLATLLAMMMIITPFHLGLELLQLSSFPPHLVRFLLASLLLFPWAMAVAHLLQEISPADSFQPKMFYNFVIGLLFALGVSHLYSQQLFQAETEKLQTLLQQKKLNQAILQNAYLYHAGSDQTILYRYPFESFLSAANPRYLPVKLSPPALQIKLQQLVMLAKQQLQTLPPDQIMEKADLLHMLGRLDEVRLLIHKTYPQKLPGWATLKLAATYHSEKNWKRSLSYSKQALEIALKQQEPQMIWQATNLLAESYYHLGHVAQAESTLRQAIARTDTNKERAKLYYKLAVFYQIRGQFFLANQHYQKATQGIPTNDPLQAEIAARKQTLKQSIPGCFLGPSFFQTDNAHK